MDEPTVKLSELIKAFGSEIVRGGSRKAAEIQAVETMFDLSLPPDYRMFLGNFGYLAGELISIFGLSESDSEVPSVASLIMMVRFHHPEMPLEVVPIEALDEQRYACIACAPDRKAAAPIVLLDIDEPIPVDQLVELAPNFDAYLVNRLISLLPEDADNATESDAAFEHAWKNFEQQVIEYQRQYEYDHAKGGKLPRNHEWRPYRYCIQDVVFGVTVVRHLREANCLQVDVFLTSDVPEYGPLGGALALTSFLLSEAYKCGGTMEIRFTDKVEAGKVPRELQELARQHSVEFSQAGRGRISSSEAKALYAALTSFSPALQTAIKQLEATGRAKMARACYVVNHGVWAREQVEMIVLGSEHPDSILGGKTQPNQWLLYEHDLLHARAALLGGMLDRLIGQRVRQTEDGIDFDMEDDLRQIEIAFDGTLYSKRYLSDDPIPLPVGWLHADERLHNIPERTPLHVLIRARDVFDMQCNLAGDIAAAKAHHEQTREPTLVLLPYNFYELPPDLRDQFAASANAAQIGLIICPDTAATFDADAARKLARSRVLRQ